MAKENGFIGLRIAQESKVELQAQAAKQGIALAELVKQRLLRPTADGPPRKRLTTSLMAKQLVERLNGHLGAVADFHGREAWLYKEALRKASGEDCKALGHCLRAYLSEVYKNPSNAGELTGMLQVAERKSKMKASVDDPSPESGASIDAPPRKKTLGEILRGK